MFTVSFYITAVVVLIVVAAIAVALGIIFEGKSLGIFGSCIAAGAVVLIILATIFGFVQADKNGKDNCTDNLGGKVTQIGCIVGDDWKIIPNY